MDKFVEKISGLSYELFAILMPGIFAIICSITVISYYQLLIGLQQCLGERLLRLNILPKFYGNYSFNKSPSGRVRAIDGHQLNQRISRLSGEFS